MASSAGWLAVRPTPLPVRDVQRGKRGRSGDGGGWWLELSLNFSFFYLPGLFDNKSAGNLAHSPFNFLFLNFSILRRRTCRCGVLHEGQKWAVHIRHRLHRKIQGERSRYEFQYLHYIVQYFQQFTVEFTWNQPEVYFKKTVSTLFQDTYWWTTPSRLLRMRTKHASALNCEW